MFFSCNSKANDGKENSSQAKEVQKKDSIAKAEKTELYNKCVKAYGGLEFGMTKEQAKSYADKEIWEIEESARMGWNARYEFRNKLQLKENLDYVCMYFSSSSNGLSSIDIESHKTTANHLDELQEDCLSLLQYFFSKNKLKCDNIQYEEINTYDINDGEAKVFISDHEWPFHIFVTVKKEYDTYEYSYRFLLSKDEL